MLDGLVALLYIFIGLFVLFLYRFIGLFVLFIHLHCLISDKLIQGFDDFRVIGIIGHSACNSAAFILGVIVDAFGQQQFDHSHIAFFCRIEKGGLSLCVLYVDVAA